MNEKTRTEGASLPRSSATVLRRVLSAAAVLFVLCLVLTTPAAAWDGISPITTAEDLQDFAAKVNAGDTFSGKTVTLGADIDLSGISDWTPIGNGSRSGSSFSGSSFSGTFDGKGMTISNLTIRGGSENQAVGLFGVINGGTIQNLILSDVSISTASETVGSAAGHMVGGSIAKNITVSGTVTGSDAVGGVAGRMTISGTIENCINTAQIVCTGSGAAGGIVGKAYYTGVGKEMNIICCTNAGEIVSQYAAGGIVGLSAANVNGCMNIGDISAATEAGGIIAEQVNYGTVSENSNSGKISNLESEKGIAYGGIIGWIRYQTDSTSYPLTTIINVTNNTNSGFVLAGECSLGAGGIIGTAYNQAYVSGNINCGQQVQGGTFAAGILGGAQVADNNQVLADCTITVSNNYVLTGEDDISTTNGNNCVDIYCYDNTQGNPFVVSDNSNTTSQYSVSSISADGGSVTVLPVTAYKGQIIEISNVQANYGYEFSSLSVDDAAVVNVGAKYLFMMPAAGASVTAEFTELETVAKIGNEGYTSLQKAIDAAADGTSTTITLIADITPSESITIPSGKVIVLDLAGHTINQIYAQTTTYAMITNKGDLTIQDSTGNGKISYTDSGNGGNYVSAPIINSGKLTIDSGSIESISGDTVAKNGYPYAIHSAGTLVVNGGNITNYNYSSIRVWCNSASEYSNATINGGYIKGAIEFHLPSETVVSLGVLEILGGTIENTYNDKALRFLDFGGADISSVSGMNLTVAGGTIIGGFGNTTAGTADPDFARMDAVVNILGGTFKLFDYTQCERVEANVAYGYHAFSVVGEDLTYEVKKAYNITWIDDEGAEGKSEFIAAGDVPERTGLTKESDEQYTYTFTGWNPTPYAADKDQTYTAVYDKTPVEYTITFNTDGGSAVEAITQGYGTEVIEPEAPTKEGYTFAGWNPALPTTMDVGGLITTAQWDINTYNITFIVDGVEYDKIEKEYNSAISEPSVPSKTGYNFAGWSPEIPATMPAVNQTITAQWTPIEYTITFVDADDESTVYGQYLEMNYGETITAPGYPVKPGYTFKAWEPEIPATMPAENLVIKVTWTANESTVIFNANGGEGEMESQTFVYDVEQELKENSFTRLGYTFDGWSDAEDGTITYTDKASIKNLADEDGAVVTLYAIWIPNTYTVIFKENAGDEEGVPQSFTYDVEQALTANAFERTGYTFGGWATVADGPVVYADKAVVQNLTAEKDDEVTLYANWTVNKYTITFDTKGGTTPAAVELPYGTEVVRLAEPAKVGYTFDGWNKTLPFTMPAEDITLEAKWKVNNYAVIWYNEDGKTKLSEEQVAFNTTPVYHGAIPTKAENTTHTFTFAGWTPTVSTVPVDGSVYTAVFTPVAKEIDEEDTEVEPEIVPEVKQEEGSNEITLIVTPSAPSTPSTPGTPGEEQKPTTPATTTIIAEDKKSATIVDSNSGVTMEIGFKEEAKVTSDDTTGQTGVTGEIKEIKVTYPVKAAEVHDSVAPSKPADKPVTQSVVIQFNKSKATDIKTLPVINSTFKPEVEKKVQDKVAEDKVSGNHKVIAMITASAPTNNAADLEKINENIDEAEGIVVTFTLPKALVEKIGGTQYLRIYHVFEKDGKTEMKVYKPSEGITIDGKTNSDNYIVSIKAGHFSSYVVGYEEASNDDDYYYDDEPTVTPTPTPTPTVTPTEQPTEQPTETPTTTVPTDVPTAQPTEPGKSPAPVAGMILGALAAAAVLRRK